MTCPRPRSQVVAGLGFQFRPNERGEASSPSCWTEAGREPGRGPEGWR